ncbi:MAG: GPR endopeptidase [Christensenellales bacterium]
MKINSDLLFEISLGVKGKQEGFKKQTFLGKYDLLKTHIEIENEKGAKILGRDVGSYTSIYTEKLDPYNTEIKNYVIYSLCEILKDYIQMVNKNAKTFLVVGVGNKNYVSDSIGPEVLSQIIITRHAKINNPNVLDPRLKSVCAISPSVLGVTGIETLDIVCGVCEKVKPDVIIVIDSIISNSYNYIGKCFQISTNGLVPGSGVDNTQKKLDANTLKTPVISIGIPLVVSCASIFEEYFEKFESQLEDLIVTKKDIDILVSNCAQIVATSVNMAIHNKMTFDEIVDYMN